MSNTLPPEQLEALAKTAEAVNDHNQALYYRCLARGRADLAARASALQFERERVGHMTPQMESRRSMISEELAATPVAWEIRQGSRVFFVSHQEFVRNSYDYGSFKALVYQQ